MCGRYVNHVKSLEKWKHLLRDWPGDVKLSYNISPTMTVPVFRDRGIGMRWGLIPHWSKDGKSKYATFNARLETVDTKPTYRSAWQHSNRCLIPALGYYEWQLEGGQKQPYFVTSSEEEPVVFAGLWDEWQGEEESILSCTIITKASSGQLRPLHDRMPVMLDPESASQWLDSKPEWSKQLLEDISLPKIEIYKVGRAVNNPRSQGQGLIEPVD